MACEKPYIGMGKNVNGPNVNIWTDFDPHGRIIVYSDPSLIRCESDSLFPVCGHLKWVHN